MHSVHRRNVIVIFVTMILTMLIVIGICAMFIVFFNTSAMVLGEDYTLFQLVPGINNTFRLYALGKEYIVDYSPLTEFVRSFSNFFSFIPSGLRFLIQIFEWVTSLLNSLF